MIKCIGVKEDALKKTPAYRTDELIYSGKRGRDFYAEKIFK